MRRKPRANSLTYRNAKKDAFKLQMSFETAAASINAKANENSNKIDETVNDSVEVSNMFKN